MDKDLYWKLRGRMDTILAHSHGEVVTVEDAVAVMRAGLTIAMTTRKQKRVLDEDSGQQKWVKHPPAEFTMLGQELPQAVVDELFASGRLVMCSEPRRVGKGVQKSRWRLKEVV